MPWIRVHIEAAECEELARLRKENLEFRTEREILKRAAEDYQEL